MPLTNKIKPMRHRMNCGYVMPGERNSDLTVYSTHSNYLLLGEQFILSCFIFEVTGRVRGGSYDRWQFDCREVGSFTAAEYLEGKFPPAVPGTVWPKKYYGSRSRPEGTIDR